MLISVSPNAETFHLRNRFFSYIMTVMENGQMENLYFGKAVHERPSFAYLHEEGLHGMSAFNAPEPSRLCLSFARQEYPSYGTSDFRCPAFEIEQRNGSRISAFKFRSYEIIPGKPSLAPLPAATMESDAEGETLILKLADDATDMTLYLFYTIYADLPILTRSAKFELNGGTPVTLTRALSMSLDLPDMAYEMMTFTGAWGRERSVRTRKLDHGVQANFSMRGSSSAEMNPFFILKRPETTEHQGEALGFNIVYSGSHLGQVECTSDGTTRVLTGIHPDNFSWRLTPGESFQTPEAILGYSGDGLNGLSRAFHDLIRTRIVRGVWRDRPRPILLNNWEATGMNFDEALILKIAEKAKDVGVELFVLDDGWFGARNDEHAGLGDWVANTDKLPGGIKGLSEKIEAMGLKFGLWIEPEMVNKDSDLYRAHPDWILSAPNRFQSHGRFQYVLDFSRKEVVDQVHSQIAKVIREAKISYIKWDSNRYITECYSNGSAPEDQGKTFHKHILGIYDLYTRLTTEFPEILFESCSSGGARYDLGMLCFAPQTWTSDNTDGYERQRIQYGTSYGYPLSSIGAHVSAVPNHQTGRLVPLSTRANVAYFGTFGYELDLNRLSADEIEKVKDQVKFMKANRELIHRGDFYRLISPFEGNETGWIVVGKDKKKALAGFYQCLNNANAGWLRFRLAGLDPNRKYRVALRVDVDPRYLAPFIPGLDRLLATLNQSAELYGDELMYAGLPLNRMLFVIQGCDFTSLLIELEAIE